MLPYQEQYIQNTREIAELSRFYSSHALSFDAWYDQQRQALERMNRLKKENAALLSAHLFPALDDLFSAPPEALAELSAFADQLMDWKTNLDCGVYVAIHDALLRMNRSIQSEGTFGIMKWDRSYKRAYRRGLNSVILEFTLVSCGFNLYKYHNKKRKKTQQRKLN